MTTKEYLEQLKSINIFIKQREEELEEIKSIAYGIKSSDTSKERITGGVKSSYKAIDKYIDMEKEINGLIDKYVCKKHEIIGNIQKMKNPVYADIVYKRYVEFKPLEKISYEMNYNYNYIRRMHGEAVKYFGTVMEEVSEAINGEVSEAV